MSNPTSSVDDHPLDDLAAYALAALDDTEREAIDDHLARCARCRDELAGHHETLAALTAGEEAPPAGIWQRVAAGIGAPDLPDPHAGTGADSSLAAPARPGAVTPPGSEVPPSPAVDQTLQDHDERPSAGAAGPSPGPAASAGPEVASPSPDLDRTLQDRDRRPSAGSAGDVRGGVDDPAGAGASRRVDEDGEDGERRAQSRRGDEPEQSLREVAAARPDDGARPDLHQAGGPVPSLTGAARSRIWRPSRVQWLAAAACLLVATATGGVVGFVLGRSGDEADISNLAQEAAQDPGAVLGTLADTGGRPVARVVTDEDGAYLVLQGLQTLPEGQAYQLWSLSGPQPVSLGMLGRDGTNTVAFRLPPTIDELAISVEPTRGQVAPTSDFQALGRITPRT